MTSIQNLYPKVSQNVAILSAQNRPRLACARAPYRTIYETNTNKYGEEEEEGEEEEAKKEIDQFARARPNSHSPTHDSSCPQDDQKNHPINTIEKTNQKDTKTSTFFFWNGESRLSRYQSSY